MASGWKSGAPIVRAAPHISARICCQNLPLNGQLSACRDNGAISTPVRPMVLLYGLFHPADASRIEKRRLYL
jgi:hypothetical protein